MKLLNFLLLISLFSVEIYAQSGKLGGKVVNKATLEHVSFANIALLNANDSSLVKGEIADADGRFSIKNIDVGEYRLNISAVGFNKYISDIISFKHSNDSVDLGQISLTLLMLKEVEIVGTKPFLEHSAGKIVMNVESSPTSAGDNALELLKKMPGVNVDKDDNISLNGKSGTLVTVNDKQTYLAGEDLANFLKSLPAEEIDKIESNTNPSAKYDAEGVAGIINITTKKKIKDGINGSVNVTTSYDGDRWSYNGGGMISARLNKWTFYAGTDIYDYDQKNGNQVLRTLTYPTYEETITSNENENEKWSGTSDVTGVNFKFNVDYEINKKNTIGTVFRMNNYDVDYASRNLYRIKHVGVTDSSFDQSFNSTAASDNYTFNVNYKHIFDTNGTQFTFDVDYVTNQGSRNAFQPANYFYGDFQDTAYRKSLTNQYYDPNNSQIISFKGDFEYNITKKAKLETGFKGSFVKNDNGINTYIDGLFDVHQSNHFIYRENIGALYGLVTYNLTPKHTFKVGLRAEYTNTEGFQEVYDSTIKKNYFDVFPNFSYAYTISKMQNLSFSYNYRITRPNYWNLNPFINIYNSYYANAGNPELKPTYSHNLSLTHSLFYAIFTSVSYARTTGAVSNFTYTDPLSQVSLTIPENMGYSDRVTFNLTAAFPIQKWWFSTNSFSYWWNNDHFDYLDVTQNTKNMSLSIWSSQTFTIYKNYSLEASGWYAGKNKTGFEETDAMYAINFGVKANFLNKKLTVSFTLNDPFKLGGEYKSTETYPNSYLEQTWLWKSTSYALRVSYKFGNEKIQLQQRKTASEEESSRSGGGSNTGPGR